MAWMKTREAIAKIPEMVFGNRFCFDFDGVPIVADGLTFRRKVNLVKLGLSHLFQANRISGLPAAIQVEPTTLCNLKCPLCPAGEGSMKRSNGVMSFETYQRILDDLGDVLLAVYLYSWGEPFLNKELVRMIEASAARRIRTLVLTNGHFLQTMEEALAVVDAGLSGLIIAVDGSTQQIYEKYRRGGTLEKVKRCAGLVEEAKARRGSQTPYTCVRALVTRDTENDLPGIEALARSLGVNMFSYKTVGMRTYDEKFREFEPGKGGLRRFEYDDIRRRHRASVQCPFPFRQPTIQWDGTVVGCEYDYDLETPWGNINETAFGKMWNSRNARTLRQSIRARERSPFCRRLCPYQDRVQDSSYLVCKELNVQQCTHSHG